jgi:hypothetical protein
VLALFISYVNYDRVAECIDIAQYINTNSLPSPKLKPLRVRFNFWEVGRLVPSAGLGQALSEAGELERLVYGYLYFDENWIADC